MSDALKLFRTPTGWIVETSMRAFSRFPRAHSHGLTAREDLDELLATGVRAFASAGTCPRPNICCRRSSSRKSGRPASPTSEAGPRGWKNRRRRPAAISTTSSTTQSGPSSSSRPRPGGSSDRAAGAGFAATRDGTSPSRSWRCVISPAGRILGYTIGNDMSSRDIEGENPLYLPQAKVYDGSCALGPCIADAPDAARARAAASISTSGAAARRCLPPRPRSRR